MKFFFYILFSGTLVDILQLGVEAKSPEDVIEDIKEKCNKYNGYWMGTGTSGICEWSQEGKSCSGLYRATKYGTNGSKLEANSSCENMSPEDVMDFVKNGCEELRGEWTDGESEKTLMDGECEWSKGESDKTQMDGECEWS